MRFFILLCQLVALDRLLLGDRHPRHAGGVAAGHPDDRHGRRGADDGDARVGRAAAVGGGTALPAASVDDTCGERA